MSIQGTYYFNGNGKRTIYPEALYSSKVDVSGMILVFDLCKLKTIFPFFVW